MTPSRASALRWTLSLIVVLTVHLGGAAALLAWRTPHDLPAAPPAVLLDMAPVAAAPTLELNDVQPGPRQEEAEPPPPEPAPVKPVEPDRLAEQIPPPEVPPEVVIQVPPPPEVKPPPPPPKKVEQPRKPQPDRKPRATQTTAPAAAPVPPAPVAAALPPGVASQPSPDMVRRWQATLVAHLQRYKRYPSLARSNNEEGVAYLRFAMDRNGAVLLKRIERASGHRALDQETLDLVERAQPLPQPPPDMLGERFEFVVPVQFQLR